MGYSGKFEVGSYRNCEGKFEGDCGLIYANAVSAVKGVSLTWDEFQKRVAEVELPHETTNLQYLLSFEHGMDALFDYSDRTLDYTLFFEKADTHDNGYGVIRAYLPNDIPENEHMIRKGTHYTPMKYEEFKNITDKCRVALDLLWLNEDIVSREEFVSHILQCKSAFDEHALFCRDAVLKNIRHVMHSGRIEAVSGVMRFLYDFVAKYQDTKPNISLVYRDGYLNLYVGEHQFPHKTKLYFEIQPLFVKNPLSNAQTVSGPEEAQALCAILDDIDEGSEALNDMIRREAKKDHPKLSFCGLF